MSKFSYDIIADILHRLPVKSLLRFRCLSKFFCSLIDDPDFTRRHLAHSLTTKSNHGLVLKDWNLYTVDFDSLSVAVEFNYHPMHAGGGTEVVGSINGIIVLRHSERNIGIYNIATRKFKPLPVSEIEPPNRSLKTGYVFYGFGYDSVRDDYKLLRMATFVGDDDDNEIDVAFEYDYDVSVYTLRTDSWKKITDVPHYLRLLNKPFYHVMHRRGYGVFACRALHWVLPCRSEIGLKNFVISFDVLDETFVEVYQPDYAIESHDFQLDVGVLEGRLCLMCNYGYEFVDIWVMEEYGVKQSWTKVFTFTGLKMTGKLLFVRPLVYSKDGEKVLLEVNNQKLIWFDWKRKRAERVRIGDSPNTFGAEMYVESLLPIGDGSEVIERECDHEDTTTDDKMRDDFLSVGFNLKL